MESETVSSDSPPVHLVPYDHAWPVRFRDEHAVLSRVIAPYLPGSIEHIGSTAIPGLVAKPTIDIMIGVTGLAESLELIPLLADLGYAYLAYRADVMHWFCKPSFAVRTFHLHAVPVGSPLWRDRLAFRDYLRTHPDIAAKYAALKLELAERHRLDRDAYTDAKGPFVQRVLELALPAAGIPPTQGSL